MRLILATKRSRLAFVAIECVVFAALAFWVGKVYLADVIARHVTTENLALASRLDPGNSAYHASLGRVYQYSLSDIDPTQATVELDRAAQLNPLDSQVWLDLGLAEEVTGRTGEAASSLRRADYLAPRLPGYQWAIANFFLLHGDTDEALRHFKSVLAGTLNYNQIIFSTAWKAVGDGDKILATVIPDNIDARIQYLDYLLGQKKLPEAHKVWDLIASSHQEFDPTLVSAYIDTLMSAGLADEAYGVWRDLVKNQLVPDTSQSSNLVSNGDFEGEMKGFGFGWRVDTVPGVYTAFDTTVFHSGGRSLLISFAGKTNPFYRGVMHWVRVTPGVNYQARAYLKTDGITTESGPRLWVFDALKPVALSKFSDQLLGTNAAWTLLTVDFTPPPNTHYVTICIARTPSQKFDNLIAGKVWVDDVSVSPLERGISRASRQ